MLSHNFCNCFEFGLYRRCLPLGSRRCGPNSSANSIMQRARYGWSELTRTKSSIGSAKRRRPHASLWSMSLTAKKLCLLLSFESYLAPRRIFRRRLRRRGGWKSRDCEGCGGGKAISTNHFTRHSQQGLPFRLSLTHRGRSTNLLGRESERATSDRALRICYKRGARKDEVKDMRKGYHGLVVMHWRASGAEAVIPGNPCTSFYPSR